MFLYGAGKESFLRNAAGKNVQKVSTLDDVDNLK